MFINSIEIDADQHIQGQLTDLHAQINELKDTLRNTKKSFRNAEAVLTKEHSQSRSQVKAMTSMDADPNMYPILIPPVSNTFHFCHHPQPHHSQPYHAQSIIYHPSFVINGNSRYQAYSITVSIFLIFSRLPSLICPPLNSVK